MNGYAFNMGEVLEGLRTVQVAKADGLDTEVYILECDGGLILVDVGFTPECLANIQAELEFMGRDWSDIKMIIITHAHGDHMDNLPQVKALTDAEVIIGYGDGEALLKETGVKPDVELEHGDLIGACGGVEIVHVPGHSNGNLCLYLRKHKAIIAGDTIFGDSEGNLEAPPEKYCSDVKMAWSNLKILADYDFNALLLSHGRNTYSSAKEKVLRLIESCG
jgi:glyoxylase-like metal-dependent hydrolase (beta-lactamase superfamily II)